MKPEEKISHITGQTSENHGKCTDVLQIWRTPTTTTYVAEKRVGALSNRQVMIRLL